MKQEFSLLLFVLGVFFVNLPALAWPREQRYTPFFVIWILLIVILFIFSRVMAGDNAPSREQEAKPGDPGESRNV